MIAVLASNNKEFMTKLLTSDIFDDFLVEEATIDTFNTFHIDGRIHKDFYKDNSKPQKICLFQNIQDGAIFAASVLIS